MSVTGSTVRYRAAIICASDRCFQGLREDASSPIIAEMLTGQGYEITATVMLPDEYEALQKTMANIADEGSADLIVTTGGTGLAPRDITPEATGKHEDNTARNALTRYRRHTKTHADYQPSRKSQSGKGKSFLHFARFGSRTFDAYRRHAGLRRSQSIEHFQKSYVRSSLKLGLELLHNLRHRDA